MNRFSGSRHRNHGRGLDPDDAPAGRHLQDFKPRTAKEIRTHKSLKKKGQLELPVL